VQVVFSRSWNIVPASAGQRIFLENTCLDTFGNVRQLQSADRTLHIILFVSALYTLCAVFLRKQRRDSLSLGQYDGRTPKYKDRSVLSVPDSG